MQESSLRSKPGLGELPRSGSVSYQFQRIPKSVEIRHSPPACCVIYWRRGFWVKLPYLSALTSGFWPWGKAHGSRRGWWERGVGAITKFPQPGVSKLPSGLAPRIGRAKSARVLPEICVGFGAFRKKKNKACTKEAFAQRAAHGMNPKRGRGSGVVLGKDLPASPAHPQWVFWGGKRLFWELLPVLI